MILRFEPGVPQVVTLASVQGKDADGTYGPQIMYRTTGGDIFYTPVDFAETLRNRRITAGQQIEICKRKNGRFVEWEIKTHPADQAARPAQTALAVPQKQIAEQTNPAYLAGNAHYDQQQPAEGSGPTKTCMEVMGCLRTAIDACEDAQKYASARGIRVQFSGEDIRAIANTVLIERYKRVRA